MVVMKLMLVMMVMVMMVKVDGVDGDCEKKAICRGRKMRHK